VIKNESLVLDVHRGLYMLLKEI